MSKMQQNQRVGGVVVIAFIELARIFDDREVGGVGVISFIP